MIGLPCVIAELHMLAVGLPRLSPLKMTVSIRTHFFSSSAEPHGFASCQVSPERARWSWLANLCGQKLEFASVGRAHFPM